MGAASIKINDDGSFNLLIGATDLGTGSDTVLGQIAAEVLGVPLEDTIVYSSDYPHRDFDNPFTAFSFFPADLKRRIYVESAVDLSGNPLRVVDLPRGRSSEDETEPRG